MTRQRAEDPAQLARLVTSFCRSAAMPSAGNALWQCLDTLIRAAGARSGAIYFSNGSELAFGAARRGAARTESMERVLAELALQGAGSPLVSRVDTIDNEGIRTMLAFPILYHDDPIGAFVAGFDRDAVPSEDLDVLSCLLAPLSLSLRGRQLEVAAVLAGDEPTTVTLD